MHNELYIQGHVQLYLMELPPNKKPKPPGPPFHALKMSKNGKTIEKDYRILLLLFIVLNYIICQV